MQEWRFTFLSEQQAKESTKIKSGASTVLGSGTKEKQSKKSGNEESFTDAFVKKSQEDLIMQMAISPLNSATGGIISPVYAASKRIIKGAAIGAVAGDLIATLSVMAIQKGLEALEQRMADLEAKASSLNNTDNALLRAGSVRNATIYSANIFGITRKTDRS